MMFFRLDYLPWLVGHLHGESVLMPIKFYLNSGVKKEKTMIKLGVNFAIRLVIKRNLKG